MAHSTGQRLMST